MEPSDRSGMGLTLTRGAAAIPSRASLTKTTWVALMLAVSGFSLVRGWLELHISQRLAAEGEFTRAHVLGKHTALNRGTTAYYLDLEYRTKTGQILVQSDRVIQNGFQRAKGGDIVPLHYLSSNPAVHALGARVLLDYVWLLMSLLFFLITGVYYFFGSV
jgi:hypothetical protein